MTFTSFLLKTVETLTPFTTLTSLSAKLTDVPMGKFTQFLIKNFIKTFNINLDEVADTDITSYKTFNDFFIRKLKPELRPIDKGCIAVCPTDGTIGQAGTIKAGRLIQAKGLDYSLKALIGGSDQDTKIYENGKFACIYLSPANYHRIHMPIDGKLIKTIHIPGKLFPVGKKNISNMPDLYTANERLVCFFETSLGILCVVMVGAALVGSIHTSWSGTIDRKVGLDIRNYESDDIRYSRGDEIGYFKYGSTVITLWPENGGNVAKDLQENFPVKMGRSMIV
ncbi:archaetidylserine decarboxylase [Succinivibrio sp.]|uniref:archaetidylserine decarboxylase n=1 Tax=Succinivibrio sp. TaxID=2053619 RepID=UPI00386C54D0